MKKVLVILMAACLILLVFAGSGTDDANTDPSNAGTSGDPVKIVLLINGTLGDKSFFDSAQNGMDLIKEKYGDRVDADTDIIISGTWQMVDRVIEVAPDYPDKKYIVYDAEVDYSSGDYSNVYSITYKQNEASFLAGAASALVSKTNVFGFVGGMDNVTINDFLVGLIAGAQYVKPEMRFATAYIGNFDDAVKAKEITLSQINNQNADVVYGCAGQAGLGSIEAAAEQGVYALGGDSDQAMSFKGVDDAKAECIITSILKRVDQSLLRAVTASMEGTLQWGTTGSFGLADESVGLAENEYYEAILTEEQRAQIDEIEQKIISGEIEVPTALGRDTQEVKDYIDAAS